MMLSICGIFFSISVLMLIIKRDIFYPAVAVNMMFALVILGYMLTSDNYAYILQTQTVIFILISVSIFSISCYVIENVFKTDVKMYEFTRNNFNRQKTVRIAYLLIFFCFFYILLRLRNYSIGSSLISYLNEIRGDDVEATSRDASAYLQPFILISWSMFLMSNLKSKFKVSKIMLFTVFLFLSFSVVLNTGKQIVFMVVLSSAYIFGIDRIKQLLILVVIVTLLFFTYMLVLRDLSGGGLYYLSMYLVSPTIAFQEYYLNNPTSMIGSNAFWFFERISGLFYGGSPTTIHKPFVYVGLVTNVYTAFSDYIYYSKELCYVLMIVFGAMSGFLWRVSKIDWKVKIFFSYFLYTFIFMFYHESFLINISSWIQFAFAIFVINYLSRITLHK